MLDVLLKAPDINLIDKQDSIEINIAKLMLNSL